MLCSERQDSRVRPVCPSRKRCLLGASSQRSGAVLEVGGSALHPSAQPSMCFICGVGARLTQSSHENPESRCASLAVRTLSRVGRCTVLCSSSSWRERDLARLSRAYIIRLDGYVYTAPHAKPDQSDIASVVSGQLVLREDCV